MFWKVIGIIAIIAVIAAVSIRIRQLREKTDRMYRAAGNIVKNEMLDRSLHNPMLNGYEEPVFQEKKLMVHFKVLNSKKAREYVFDAHKPIKIGRDRSENSITLSEAIVSLEHCRIYADRDSLYLADCGSSNGTIVKRGMKSYRITGGQQVTLESGDTLVIGSTQLRIRIFVFDTVWM